MFLLICDPLLVSAAFQFFVLLVSTVLYYKYYLCNTFEWYTYILLTTREGRTGRILARGLDSTDRAQRGPYKKDRGPISAQYGPEQAWLIRDLLHDWKLFVVRIAT